MSPDTRRERLIDALQAALLLADNIVIVSHELATDASKLLNAIERAIAALPPAPGRKEPGR